MTTKTMTVFEAIELLNSLNEKVEAFDNAFTLLEAQGDQKSVTALEEVRGHYVKRRDKLKADLDAITL